VSGSGAGRTSLAPGCWVGRKGDVLLVSSEAGYFVIDDPSSADLVEEVLKGEDQPVARLAPDSLREIGLLAETLPRASTTDLANAVLGKLAERGIRCALSPASSGQASRPPDAITAILDFAYGPVALAGTVRAAEYAATARLPLVTILRAGSDVAVCPALAPDGQGCGYCVWMRHAATLPRQAGAVVAPGHRLVAASMTAWAADWVEPMARCLADAVQASLCRDTSLVTVVQRETWTASEHAFLPRPDCPACGKRPRPAIVADVRDPATSPWCGLITSITDSTRVSGLRSALASGALALRPDGTPAAPLADLSRGLATDQAGARTRARGEALERYAARMPWTSDIRARPPRGGDVLTLADLWPAAPGVNSRSGEMPQASSDRIGENIWGRATWLTGGDVWIPWRAMTIGARMPGSAIQVTSNGVAAAPTADEARERAIAELLERDAFLTTWVHRNPARKIMLANDEINSLTTELQRQGTRPSLWRLTAAAPVPVVLAIAQGDGERNLAITLGAACDVTVERAAVRAIRELAGNVAATAEEIRAGALTAIPERDVRQIDDHAAYYLSPERNAALGFLADAASRQPVPPPAGEDTDTAVDLIRECLAAGVRVATCDLTPPDVAACGISVVRAVSPDLVPLWFGWHREPVAHRRLRCVSPNRQPHPFR
jgi:ribosomal protein S12 methylthiotransferase accessory factor